MTLVPIEQACLATAALSPMAGVIAVRARAGRLLASVATAARTSAGGRNRVASQIALANPAGRHATAQTTAHPTAQTDESAATGRRVAVISSWVAAGAAGCVLALVAACGPVQVSLLGGPGQTVLGLVANPATACLLVLICGVGALVQSFAGRYLQADAASDRFAARALLVVSAMAAVATSSTLTGLIVAWIVAGSGFVAVASYRRDLPGVTGFVTAASRALVVGDGCLAGAGLIVWMRAGNVTLGPGSLAEATLRIGSWRALVAVLIAVAVAARSAQGIFRGWLARTVAAPTPASALLHAGVVNGGGILLIRLGVLAAWPPALAGLLLVSSGTAVWAGAVVAYQGDVKGQLASSTASQMGFMLAECSAGAWAAAMIHLIGHGLYKASMFLSSGSAVARPSPVRLGSVRRTPRRAAAAMVTASAAAAAAAPGLIAGDGWVLAGYAGLSALTISGLWWSRRPARTPSRLAWLAWPAWPALLVTAAGMYGAIAAVTARFLLPALPVAAIGLGTPWLLVPAAGTAAVAVLARSEKLGLALRLRLANAGAPGTDWDLRVIRPRIALRPAPAPDDRPAALGTETA